MLSVSACLCYMGHIILTQVACDYMGQLNTLNAATYCTRCKVFACFDYLCVCSSFFSRKDGPYIRTLSLGQVWETFSVRNFQDWLDWIGSKSMIKVGLHCGQDCYVADYLQYHSRSVL